jgi:hypothetical protein
MFRRNKNTTTTTADRNDGNGRRYTAKVIKNRFAEPISTYTGPALIVSPNTVGEVKGGNSEVYKWDVVIMVTEAE